MMRVLKLDLSGAVKWKYEARLLRRDSRSVVLEANFDKPDFPLLDLVIRKGDRFVETYYEDRGYNYFEIYDAMDGAFKGWYCNLSRPARIDLETVSWVDLALDLWVWPDGRTAVLDEDEFEALPLVLAERHRVRADLAALKQRFSVARPKLWDSVFSGLQ